MLQPVYIYFKKSFNHDYISVWKSRALSDKIIKYPAASNNSLVLALNHINIKFQVKFDRSCLKQEKVTFTHKKVVNVHIVYEINLWSNIQGTTF